MHLEKWFHYSSLVMVCTLVFATTTNGYVVYDPYFGPIGLLPPQYRFNPFYHYLVPQVPIPSSWQLTRSDDIIIPNSEDITPEAADATVTKSENATVPTVGLLNAPVARREEIPGLATFVVPEFLIGSGTLITQRHVLTAGHVATDINNNVLGNVRALINTGTITWPDANSEIRSVVNVYIHPDFSRSPYYSNIWRNDIAIVRLNSPVPNVPRVRLSFDELLDGELAFMYGFGYSGLQDPLKAKQKAVSEESTPARHKRFGGANWYTSNKLRKGSMRATPKSTCYYNYNDAELLNQQYICLWPDNQLCKGDGGVPLMKNGMQFGVASSNYDGCSNSVPAIFMRVGAFRDWIAYTVDL